MIEIENEDAVYELVSTMASFAASDWEDNIDFSVFLVFSVIPSSDKYLNLSSDVTFYKSINSRRDISKTYSKFQPFF